MTKLVFEEELEKLSLRNSWYKYYVENRNVKLIVKKIKEELNKRKVQVRLEDNNYINENEWVIKLSDFEEVFGK